MSEVLFSSQWRQNGRDSVSNHQLNACPHKWPVTRKMFPFDDVIMSSRSREVLTCQGCGFCTPSLWGVPPRWYGQDSKLQERRARSQNAGNKITHWGRVTHLCVSKLTNIASDNGLSPGRRQAITWTNIGILLIGPLGTNFSEMLIEIHTFSFKKILLKMSSAKWRPFVSASMW